MRVGGAVGCPWKCSSCPMPKLCVTTRFPLVFQSSPSSFLARTGIMTDSDSRGQTAVMARSPWLMGASRAILLYISTTSAWAGRAWEHVEQKQLSLLAPLDKPFIPPPKKFFLAWHNSHSWRDLKSLVMWLLGTWVSATLGMVGNGLGGLFPSK